MTLFVKRSVSVSQQILAPYTDFHYRHTPDIAEGQLKWVPWSPRQHVTSILLVVFVLINVILVASCREDREARFMASKMSIVASFRSWSGNFELRVFKTLFPLCTVFISARLINISWFGTCWDICLYSTVGAVFLWLTPLHLAGIINLCKSSSSGIESLIGLLCIPNMEVRVGAQCKCSHTCLLWRTQTSPKWLGCVFLFT